MWVNAAWRVTGFVLRVSFRERPENRVLETALVSCRSAHENDEGGEYDIMIHTQYRQNSGRFGLLDFILDGCFRVQISESRALVST